MSAKRRDVRALSSPWGRRGLGEEGNAMADEAISNFFAGSTAHGSPLARE